MRISAKSDHICGSKVPKPPSNGHYMDADLVRKIWKIVSLANTNAILMKLTAIVYLYKAFNLENIKV